MWRAWERREMYSQFWWGNLTNKDNLGDTWNGSTLRNRLRDMNWTNMAQDMDT